MVPTHDLLLRKMKTKCEVRNQRTSTSPMKLQNFRRGFYRQALRLVPVSSYSIRLAAIAVEGIGKRERMGLLRITLLI